MQFKALLKEYQDLVDKHKEMVNETLELDTLLEAPMDMPEGADLVGQLETLTQRIESAKRALGITNRLTDPADKKKHRSRVMAFLNQLRGMFDRVIRQMQQEMEHDDGIPTLTDMVKPGVPSQVRPAAPQATEYRAAA